MAREVCFGIIGAGGIAQSQHLPNAQRVPHIRLKTICDVREEVLSAMRVKYGIPHATREAGDVFADPEIEAVIVATGEESQGPLTIRALEAGRHVYVEKPLAASREGFLEVIAAQRRSGRHVAVGLNRRFAPAYRLAREIVIAGGGARNIHYRISDDYVEGWGRGYPPGARLFHELCHVFDVLRWLTGSEAGSVYCAGSRRDDEVVAIRFASGCVASIMNSGYATPDLPKERLEVICGRGGITVEEFVELRVFGQAGYEPVYRFPGHTHPDREGSYAPLFGTDGESALHAARRRYAKSQGGDDRTPYINYMVDKGWIASLDGFAASLGAGKAPENAGPEDALKAHMIAVAAARSLKSGQPASCGES